MFEKFGEFDSAEELNRTAEGLLKEGDTASILELAEENGIDKEDAEDYIAGDVEEFANPLMAALGKLDVECRTLKPEEIMADWVEYIRIRCRESEEMAGAVRKRGKSLEGCITELLKWSFAHKKSIDSKTLKAAGVNAGGCALGIPGMGRAKQIITEYYMN